MVTSNMAPAHPHATGLAVYPALFLTNQRLWTVNALPLLPKYIVSLCYHCPCPAARDLSSRVSDLVSSGEALKTIIDILLFSRGHVTQ